MGEEAQEVQLQAIDDQETKEAESLGSSIITNQSRNEPQTVKHYKWWIKVSIYTIFLLLGQTLALILGRMYFVKGGNSKWIASIVQIAGFPVLLPIYYFISNSKNSASKQDPTNPSPSILVLSAVYLSLGLLIAANCYLYSIGLQYLPVSTYTLITASQLGFNALFSFFLNKQKFTPFIINSLFLLTISSTLLAFNNESTNPRGVSKQKYVIGFVSTVGASALFGLALCLTQFCFKNVIKMQTFKVVLDLIIYQSLVASLALVVGLFGSGEWNGLWLELEGYQLGKVSYLMTLIWTGISWQIYAIGCVGLIFEVSSLFSNSISVVGLPIVPVLAVFVFHDKMDGVKVISMVLAVWGFASYVYQHYLDDRNTKVGKKKGNQITKATTSEGWNFNM